MLRRLCVSMVALAACAAGLQAQQRPPAVHVIEGACPFECCTYGRWQSERTVDLRAEPRGDAVVTGRAENGDTVTAVTGHVRTVPTPFVFRTDFDRFEAGDTVWVLDYLGEGYFGVWWNGERVEASLDFSPYGGTAGSMCERCEHGSLLREHDSQWWVLIRTASGRQGWTSETDAFSGSDLCACE